MLFAGGAVQQLPKGLGTAVGETGKPGQVSFASKRYVDSIYFINCTFTWRRGDRNQQILNPRFLKFWMHDCIY